MLVFAADLEEVEEVGRGRVDGDEVFVWFRCRSGKLGYSEVVRSLVNRKYGLLRGESCWNKTPESVYRSDGLTCTYSLI